MKSKSRLKPAPVVRPNGGLLSDTIASSSAFYYLDHEGVRLRVMLARPDTKDPRGSIIFCPGRTEFIEKYLETVEDFLARGFFVLILDPRGQGLSDRLLPDRLKSFVHQFQDYADDLAFVTESFADDLPKPYIVMGHSMGGCIALMSVISGVMNPSAVVCSAPMLGLFDVNTKPAELFVRFFNILGFSKRNLPFQKQDGGLPVSFKGNKLTSDPDRFARWASYFKSTPELRVAGPTFRWISESLKAMTYVNRNANRLKIPGLIIAAGADPIVDPASNASFARAASIDYHVVPGALHEVLMEKDVYRDQFFSAFDDFLKKQGL
ncbi:MAG: alpha/beta hydrolase [Hellea sp.]|nr:alpha/beta hydrolase [Hellea sp.]